VPAPKPVCTVSASPSSVTPGIFSTMVASCTPFATSYVWTGGTCGSSTYQSCTASPSATTTYTVAGTNTGGTGTPASVTVTVVPVPKPVCTVSASPASVTAGGYSTMIATCSPIATAFVWTGGNCSSSVGSTCLASPSATTTYTVAGTNAGGTGTPTSVTVTVNSAPKPVCTVSASPSAITPGIYSSMVASCTPYATSYVWTGGTCVSSTYQSCTASPSATTTYTVAGTNAAGTGTPTSVTVTVLRSAQGATANALPTSATEAVMPQTYGPSCVAAGPSGVCAGSQ
jgi:hypothetical protein